MRRAEALDPKTITRCGSCTLHLVQLCYERSAPFRWFREPLLRGMNALAWWHRIDPRDYDVRSEACRGCIRFRKNALKQVSPTFRVLNDLANPWFNRWRDSLVSSEEIAQARSLPSERGLSK
ncbi:MAG: nitroreductase [Deltaproteobacteria bacterium]|nr:nitroreductase [Deltaproteobacteria bacterium]